MSNTYTLPNEVTVEGRRWFDSINGNTYHSVRVTTDQGHALQAGMAYGYGDQYMQSAYELLTDAGILPALRYSNGVGLTLRRICDAFNITLHDNVQDVGRKRDLHERDEEE